MNGPSASLQAVISLIDETVFSPNAFKVPNMSSKTSPSSIVGADQVWPGEDATVMRRGVATAGQDGWLSGLYYAD